MHDYSVGYFVGSLAKGSLNRKLALALTRLAPESLTLREIPIGNLPLYSFCNSPQMNAIEAYIQFTPGLITDDGEVTEDSTAEFLRDYMKQFHAFIERVYMALSNE